MAEGVWAGKRILSGSQVSLVTTSSESGSAVFALYCFASVCKHLTVVLKQNLYKSSCLCRFSTLKDNSLLGVFSLLSWFNIS